MGDTAGTKLKKITKVGEKIDEPFGVGQKAEDFFGGKVRKN